MSRAADAGGLGSEKQVLVVNAGSSSLKMKLLPSGESVTIERLGGPTTARASFALIDSPRLERHDHAFDFALRTFEDHLGPLPLAVVGHRVVHGGTRFVAPTLITAEVEEAIEALCPLAPLPTGNLAAIRRRGTLTSVPHVAIFDTAFHATLRTLPTACRWSSRRRACAATASTAHTSTSRGRRRSY